MPKSLTGLLAAVDDARQLAMCGSSLLVIIDQTKETAFCVVRHSKDLNRTCPTRMPIMPQQCRGSQFNSGIQREEGSESRCRAHEWPSDGIVLTKTRALHVAVSRVGVGRRCRELRYCPPIEMEGLRTASASEQQDREYFHWHGIVDFLTLLSSAKGAGHVSVVGFKSFC
jgi:hypothetical protein